jgi:hypothetical protein
LEPAFIDFSFPARGFSGGNDSDFFFVFIVRLRQGVNDYEDHDTVYQPDGQPSFLKFIVVHKAEGAWVVEDERGALKADAVFGKVPVVLSLVPGKTHSDDVHTIMHVREEPVKQQDFGNAKTSQEITLVLYIKSLI